MSDSITNQNSKIISPPLISINPATGQTINEYEAFSHSKIEHKINGSQKIWEDWRLQPFNRRTELLDNLSKKLQEKKEQLSEIITNETGKPFNQSVREIEKCSLLCSYYREYGEHFLSPKEHNTQYLKSYVYYAPLGGIFGIMPWNFPFWQVFRFAIPAITAGNAIFLKHSENVSGCALAIEELFYDSSCPAGIFTNLLMQRSAVETVIAHPFIKMVSFTGSTQGGSQVASLCGQYLKKSIMELGGSDPYIVFDDAHIGRAAESIVESRLNNSGQSCIAAKRVIAEKNIYDELVQALINELSQKTISNPLYNPDVGPLAKKQTVDHLSSVVENDVKEGAKILFQKHVKKDEDKENQGFYFPITLLGDCSTGMRCHQEECFGPLLPVFKVEDETEAIQMGNNTRYGLGAAVFTENKEKGERIAQQYMQAGSCFVNGVVKSNPSLPFGGIHQSGYGRELSSEGLKEFCNIKTVVVS